MQLGWVRFVYDDNGQLIGEYDEQGNPLRLYVWLENMPIAMLDTSGIHYLHTDHLHTPRAATDATGAISWRADYTPFGEVTETVSQIEMNLRFPGQYHDRETGLHQNWHREYAPHLGRYTQSDPIGLDGGLNLYSYAGGNPITYVDILGLAACRCVADPFTKDHFSEDIPIRRFFVFPATGSRHRVTCTYRCTRPDGSSENVRASHSEQHSHPQSRDSGKEGVCIGADFKWQFRHDLHRAIATPTQYRRFDPAESRSDDLKRWAEVNCGC